MSVMTSGRRHQAQDPLSCGLVAQPRPLASCLGLRTTAHLSDAVTLNRTSAAIVQPVLAATACE